MPTGAGFVPPRFVCPITKKLMLDPEILVDDGITYSSTQSMSGKRYESGFRTDVSRVRSQAKYALLCHSCIFDELEELELNELEREMMSDDAEAGEDHHWVVAPEIIVQGSW